MLIQHFNIKICILTDFTLREQVKKLKTLQILNFIDKIITSEEVGYDKPTNKIFLYALHKLNVKPHEVCMIGDNYDKDIIGALNCNI